MVMKERDEELALFFAMRRKEIEEEKNKVTCSLRCSDEFDVASESDWGGFPVSKNVSSAADKFLRFKHQMERDEEVALFLEMRRKEIEEEKNKITSSLRCSDEHDVASETDMGGSPVLKISSSAADKVLNSENHKTECNWLLTQPTTLLPNFDKDPQKTVAKETGKENASPTALKSQLNALANPALRVRISGEPSTMPLGSEKSSNVGSRSSSSKGRVSGTRSSTPTARPNFPTNTKTSRSSTPTSRTTLRCSAPSKATTTTSTTPLPTLKTKPRSSTPNPRSSTPSSAPCVANPPPTTPLPTLKTKPRSSTPSSAPCVANPRARSSSVTKSVPTTVQTRSLKPLDMPGFSHETPPNLKTSLPDRPASASRGRPRQQSFSPARGRVSNGSVKSRENGKNSDYVNPVLIGTKMVERVVNMRKLAPPNSMLSGKSPSIDNSTGFGRTLSKKSFEMALRHMDITNAIPTNLRPLVTSIPVSSMNSSIRSESSRTGSTSDSPLATTSSNASNY